MFMDFFCVKQLKVRGSLTPSLLVTKQHLSVVVRHYCRHGTILVIFIISSFMSKEYGHVCGVTNIL